MLVLNVLWPPYRTNTKCPYNKAIKPDSKFWDSFSLENKFWDFYLTSSSHSLAFLGKIPLIIWKAFIKSSGRDLCCTALFRPLLIWLVKKVNKIVINCTLQFDSLLLLLIKNLTLSVFLSCLEHKKVSLHGQSSLWYQWVSILFLNYFKTHTVVVAFWSIMVHHDSW